MTEELKKSPLACILFGILLGIGGTVGFQSIVQLSPNDKITKIVDIPEDDIINELFGVKKDTCTVMVTRSGKYHKPSCYHLKKAKNPQRMKRQDAIAKGKVPCKTCKPEVNRNIAQWRKPDY